MEAGAKNVASAKKKEGRNKHKCPFPKCNAVVIHLPRHMRGAHGWSKQDSNNVLNSFNLRKERAKVSGKRNRVYRGMICPVGNCRSVVKRIHNHLTDVHKFERGTSRYKDFLACAVRNEVQVISSESSCNDSSSLDECDKTPWKKKPQKWRNPKKSQKPKKHEHPSIFKTVYSSSELEDESSEDEPKKMKYMSPDIEEENSDEDASDLALEGKPTLSSSSPKNIHAGSSFEDTSGEDSDDFDDIEILGDNRLEQTEQSNVQGVFEKFQSWLEGPDGGRKDKRCAIQCSRQVQMVVHAISPENPKLSNIFHKNILRDKWLTEFEKKRQPGTVKSYLGALNKFYVFLKSEKLQSIDATPEILGSLQDQMKLWIKSYRNLIKGRFWEKRMDDISKLKTPKQVKDFDSSDVARRAIKLLGDFQDPATEKTPNQTEYTMVRDYLLTIVCINNGSRSGALANMTLGEFNKAQKDGSDFIVKVKKHKTFTTHGPAHLIFASSIHKWMHIFITRFRNRMGDDVSTDDNEPVFLTWNQRPIHSSHVGKQIGSCWGKVFGEASSTGGATAFRKAAVSAVQERKEGMRDDLANLMVHNKATADRYYVLQAKTKSAVVASRKLTRIMHDSVSPVKNDDCQPQEPMATRRKWTSDEEDALLSLFSNQIKERSISIEEVKKIAKEHPLISKIPCLKIRDKIRSLFKDDQRELPASLPDEVESSQELLKRFGLASNEKTTGQKESDRSKDDDNGGGSNYTPSLISPSVSTSKIRKSNLFTEEETTAFRSEFMDLIRSKQPIKKLFILAKVKGHPTLKHLMKKHTGLQLADKVRTERKIFERGCE